MIRFSLQRLSVAALAAALACFAAACNNDSPEPEPEPKGSQLDRVANAVYYGSRTGTIQENFYLQLSDAACREDENGHLVPTDGGMLLTLDFWAPFLGIDELALPEGEYVLSDSYDDRTLDVSSTCLQRDNGTTVEIYFFVSGSATVARDGNTYTITARFIDGASVEHAFHYRGAIEWTRRDTGNDDPIARDVRTTFIGGDGIYFGDRDKNGLGFFELYLYDVPLEGNFLSREGHMLVMQLYAPLQDDSEELIFLPEGTYAPSKGSPAEFRFVEGSMELHEDHFMPAGSVAEYDDADGAPHYGMIDGGTLTVRRTGDSYTIACKLGMEKSLTFEADYTGAIPMENRSGWREGGGGFSTLHYDIEVDLSDRATGTMQCMGDFYRVGCSTWAITVGGGEGETMQFEVLCPPDATDAPVPGRYPVMPDFAESSFKTGWAVLGHMQGPYPAGTWYFDYDDTGTSRSHAPMNEGYLDLAVEGELYTLTFEFKDDSTEPFNITGTWTGRLELPATPASAKGS